MSDLPWYIELSQRPLQILIFLAPLVVLYAVGTWMYAFEPETGDVVAVSAYLYFNQFFSVFGVTSLYLPGIALVVVLFIWHLLVRDRWEVHAGVPILMWIESCLLAIPLLVLYQIIMRVVAPPALMDVTQISSTLANSPMWSWLSAPGTPASISDYPWQTRLVLSIGAGIYEELLFRMVAIALVHFVMVDLLRFSHRTGAMSAIVLSALAFTLYHGVLDDGETGVEWTSAIFFFLSGLYFAGLFVVRGFGIAVGVHAAYDIVVTVLASVFPHAAG